MSKLKKPQLVLIAFAVFFIVLLLLLPKVKESSEIATEELETESSDALVASTESLNEQDKILYQSILEKIESAPGPMEKIEWHDSLSLFWERRGQLLRSADELSEIAGILEDKPSYFIAADAYFRAFQEGEESQKKLALENAINSYELIIESNPDDLEAMTSLGVCYVEGSALLGQPPMKGIGLLKQVLEKDPNNVNALVNLGYFSTKSGQFDLAVERFEKVLEIDPEFADAYLYLADVFVQKGQNDQAVQYLESYSDFIKEPAAKKQFEEYIESIKEFKN